MASTTPVHPYYPLGVSIPNYKPNTLDTRIIIAAFITACSMILVPALIFLRRARSSLSTRDAATAMWFMLCGFIHVVVEGSFVLHHVADSSTILSQLWKEYSLSDSRYLTRDAFMVCMETITAFAWGPLSFLLVHFILDAHPARHFVQTVISLGQMYGVVLYYAIFVHDNVVRGIEYSRPEKRYLYGYMVLANSFWLVIPALMLVQSGFATVAAFAGAAKRANKGRRG
ncbi:hypothetical protein CDD82_2716 [Ophiocordyceps australis]|uniref:EXPERA domain-containing protein n=1 Tax=Ophiocordyceps australis TaxID=1399860 RepID=A0A2C5ZGL7_9HYPO|nr:hypothetical protein CDD82_2716 [Ophiocordyceps australis]